MGATSVTGVGQGSAEKIGCKGSEHMRLGVSHLIGPHIIDAGTVTLSSGAFTLHVPLLPGVAGNYIVLTGNQTSTNGVHTALTLGTDTQVIFTGNGSDVIAYSIVLVGQGGPKVNAGNGTSI